MIPALNLRNVPQTEPAAGSNRSAALDDPQKSVSVRTNESSVRTPMSTAVETPSALRQQHDVQLFGVDVNEITDVAVLRDMVITAQRMFVDLEHRYEAALESKEIQLKNLVEMVMSEHASRIRTSTLFASTTRPVVQKQPAHPPVKPHLDNSPSTSHIRPKATQITPRASYVPATRRTTGMPNPTASPLNRKAVTPRF